MVKDYSLDSRSISDWTVGQWPVQELRRTNSCGNEDLSEHGSAENIGWPPRGALATISGLQIDLANVRFATAATSKTRALHLQTH
jgi:hypothetical protein